VTDVAVADVEASVPVTGVVDDDMKVPVAPVALIDVAV
jgi:hypothetical protein